MRCNARREGVRALEPEQQTEPTRERDSPPTPFERETKDDRAAKWHGVVAQMRNEDAPVALCTQLVQIQF